jgi:hypothetical protein
MAHCVISLRRKVWSLSEHSGHWSAQALNGSVVNDPYATWLTLGDVVNILTALDNLEQYHHD